MIPPIFKAKEQQKKKSKLQDIECSSVSKWQSEQVQLTKKNFTVYNVVALYFLSLHKALLNDELRFVSVCYVTAQK